MIHGECSVKIILSMHIGIPKETKAGETRVAVSPAGVHALRTKGHVIFVQSGAGRGSGWTDADYRQAGATMVRAPDRLFRQAELLCKVKEPQPEEIKRLRPGQILFTFLHLAGSPRLLSALRRQRIVALGYETIETKTGRLPLLSPMSDVAGRVAALLGTHFLRSDWGGKGILLSRIAGEPGGTIGVIGCGHVGRAAIDVAVGLGAQIIAVDRNPAVLQKLKKRYGAKIQLRRSTSRQVLAVAQKSDLLIGAVLVPGRRAPHVITREMVQAMEAGSVIIDVAVDQGGCVETIRPTSIEAPVFKKYGVLHCAIPNLPALAPRTASHLLAQRVLPYLLKLANLGWEEATRRDQALAKGLNLVKGKIVYPGLL